MRSEPCTLVGVIRTSPPSYGVCRAKDCRKNLEWVTTLKGKKIPLSLPVKIERVYERNDGTMVTVVDFGNVHWATCAESRMRLMQMAGTRGR